MGSQGGIIRYQVEERDLDACLASQPTQFRRPGNQPLLIIIQMTLMTQILLHTQITMMVCAWEINAIIAIS
jgi:hypothetical protein